MKHLVIGHTPMDLETLREAFAGKYPLSLDPGAVQRIRHCRDYLDSLSHTEPVYGVNTGFGSLCNEIIRDEDTALLQENLVRSHACGAGAEMPHDVVRLMLLLKVIGLSRGQSGVHLNTVQRLIDFYNHDILPVVYSQGSLGASGDLAPAHA